MSVVPVITMPPDNMNIAGVTVSRLSAFNSYAQDMDQEIVKYIWDFGDGTFYIGPEAYHVYQTPGTKTVTLTVIGDQFSQASTTIQIVVANFSGKAYFVSSSTGDDSNPGTNPRPFKTIQKAIDSSSTGKQNNPDVICLKRGDTWDQSGDIFANLPSIWISYGNGADPVINMKDGTSFYSLNGFHEIPANTYGYSTYVNGIVFNWPANGVSKDMGLRLGAYGSQATNCTIKNAPVESAGGAQKIILKKTEITGSLAAGFFGSGDWDAIINCNIHANGSDNIFHHQVYMSMNSNVLIKGSTLSGQGAIGASFCIAFAGTHKFYVADCDLSHSNYGMNLGTNGEATNREGETGLVERCAIHDMGEFGAAGAFWFSWMIGAVIKNCLIFNCDKATGQAVFIFTLNKADKPTSDIRVFNNTIYSNDTHDIMIGTFNSKIAFKNNIFYRDNINVFMDVDSSIDVSTLDFDYNTYFNTNFGPDDNRAFLVQGPQSFNDWRNKFKQDKNSVWGDPKFVDGPNHNFHLQSDSAAKDMALSIANVWGDFANGDRYKDLNYDAGAFIA